MKIKIIEVNEITTKSGSTFTAYKAVTKEGRKIDCRFTRAVDPKMLPQQPCYIVVDENMANVDTNRQYPVLWVKDIISVEPFESRNNLSDFFGE